MRCEFWIMFPLKNTLIFLSWYELNIDENIILELTDSL